MSWCHSCQLRHFNPRSPQGERLSVMVRLSMLYLISIHAPRRGSDQCSQTNRLGTKISIHAPRRGSDIADRTGFKPAALFQSTLPAGGATAGASSSRLTGRISIHAPRRGSDQITWCHSCQLRHFNPRSPQGERLGILDDDIGHIRDFNPRSPQGERPRTTTRTRTISSFQSTLPAGGATYDMIITGERRDISIHAPRRGSDGKYA